MILIGRIINNKKQDENLIKDLSSRFDGSMETSVAILEVEDILVKAGFLTWEEVESAEIA